MSLYQSVSTKRGSEAISHDGPNKLTKKYRPSPNQAARSPVRPTLRRSGSTRSIFAGALELFSHKNTSASAFDTQGDEEREIGFAKDEEEPISKFRLRQMPSLLSLSSMIRGVSSKSSVPITPSPTATSFLSNNTTTDDLPALVSPTESNFSTTSQDSISTVISVASAPVDLPFSPSFVRGEDEWDTTIGDTSTATIDLQGSYTPVCYEGVWGKTVKKDSAIGANEAERQGFLSVM